MTKTDGSAEDATAAHKTTYHHGDLRAHLIATVRHLVEEKGADGFSISEAARRAGVSSAAPYKHFADKTEIVAEVALEGIRRMGEAMETAARSASDGRYDKVIAIGEAYVTFARDHPGEFRLMFGLTESHIGNDMFKVAGEETYGVLIREVGVVLPNGTPPEEIRRRSYMLWTFVHGHSFLQIDGKVDAAEIAAIEQSVLQDISRRILDD